MIWVNRKNMVFLSFTISIIIGSFLVFQPEGEDRIKNDIFPDGEYRFVFNNTFVEISPSHHNSKLAYVDDFHHPGLNFIGEGWDKDGRKISSSRDEICTIVHSFFLYCVGFSPTDYQEEVISSQEIFGDDSSGISDISIGNGHACALGINNDSSGNLICWGDDDKGQLGTFSIGSIGESSDIMEWTHISLGESHTCAVADGTDVYCWGDNSLNQIGFGLGLSSNTPILIQKFPEGVQEVESGHHHTCIKLTSNDVKCWGWNAHGQAGIRTESGASLNSIEKSWGDNAELVAEGNTTCMVDYFPAKTVCWGKYIFTGLESDIDFGTSGSQILLINDPEITLFSFNENSYCVGEAIGRVGCYDINGMKINAEVASPVPYKKIHSMNHGYCGLTESDTFECTKFEGSNQQYQFRYNNLLVTSGIETNSIIGLINNTYRSQHTFYYEDRLFSDTVTIDVEISEDTDGDGWPDYLEIECNAGIYNSSIVPFDTDRDSICNKVDDDDDGDGIPDARDKFPLDRTEWRDDDGDGIGSNSDSFEISDGLLSAGYTTILLSVLGFYEMRRDSK